MKTIIGTLFFFAVIIFAAWWLLQNQPAEVANTSETGPLALEGEIVCLPHRISTGAQTLECAYGLRGFDGNYYMLRDMTATSGPSAITSIPTGSHVAVEGNFTPQEDNRYATIGIISAHSIEVTEKAPSLDEKHSDGTITFSTPEDFGLAISDEQILLDTVLPPCASGFLYCLYYLGDEYENTNFESAGVAIFKREDLTSETACLQTPPSGYEDMTTVSSTTETTYSMSLFTPLQDAATGHYANGEDYRLYTNSACYQFMTRTGVSQFENYPAGSIDEFTAGDQMSLANKLRAVISEIMIEETGEQLMVPML